MTLRSRLMLGVGAKALALTAMTAGASATCMSSASSVSGSIPSISATEVSTAQAVEMVRRRQQEQQGVALASFTPAQPAAQTTQVSQGAAPQPKGGAKPHAKQAARPAPAPEPVYPTAAPSRGVWAQGYVDYEKRNDITIDVARPGEIDRKETSAGFLAGGDVTFRFNSSGSTGLMLGLFGGYNEAHGKESRGEFRDDQGFGTPEFFRRTNAEQDTSGGIIGAYAAFFQDRFSWQTVVKVDLYDAKQSDVLKPLGAFDADPTSCFRDAFGRSASANLTNTILESNVSYRLDAGRDSWIEPIAGLRYTHTDYSDQRGDFIVGADGDVLRVQGGLRYGTFWRMPQGFLTTTLTGMLYSDVWVDGFRAQPGSFGPATLVTDEGELRVLGQVAAKWDRGDGSSYLFQVETRGGEDLFGIGGRIGARYEW